MVEWFSEFVKLLTIFTKFCCQFLLLMPGFSVENVPFVSVKCVFTSCLLISSNQIQTTQLSYLLTELLSSISSHNDFNGTGKTKNGLPVGNIFYRKSNISALHNSISLLYKCYYTWHLHFCNSKSYL